MKLGWGFVKLIARKTNERFRSLRYSLHPEGGWLCMQHPGPRSGASIFEATKEQTGAARRSWQPGFRPFAGAGLPSATQAAMDTHIRIIPWGDMAQKLFWTSEKRPLSGAARSHANLLRCGSVPPFMSGSCFARILGEVCGVHLLPCIPSARFGILYSMRPKR